MASWRIPMPPAMRALKSRVSLGCAGISACCKRWPAWLASRYPVLVILLFKRLLARSTEPQRILILADALNRCEIVLVLPLNMSTILREWNNSGRPSGLPIPFNLTARFAEIATILRSGPPPSVAPSIIRPGLSPLRPDNMG